MTRLPLRLLAAALPAAGIAGLLWLSHRPVAVHAADEALLRMAWSARPERIETCREVSAGELERLPRHMRQRVVCEGTTAAYRLRVARNGETVHEQIVRGGGLRQDRRLYVFVEIPLPAGHTDVDVTFERTVEAGAEVPPPQGAALPGGPETAARSDHVPARLEFRRILQLAPREVALVTYDAGARALVLRRRP